MDKLGFFEVVDVVETDRTAGLGIQGASGFVLGIAEEDDYLGYLIVVDGETYNVQPPDVRGTGRHVPRESFYRGAAITVAPEEYSDSEG
ncbi:hypothetical protein SAMN05216188_12587 [Lentzea xinjiangensis]|uniref:Immunity protein 31 n=1 Tax=Lentzea xinjiangensis TaxID=402600 RepID=A0A1H9VB76_9PSEU|nr:hypothetical protein [Lentzea xinjiangensis]SES18932.1 hypothetical protein SAMN05216188_12587 [Lentzea xinjiangensis]